MTSSIGGGRIRDGDVVEQRAASRRRLVHVLEDTLLVNKSLAASRAEEHFLDAWKLDFPLQGH